MLERYFSNKKSFDKEIVEKLGISFTPVAFAVVVVCHLRSHYFTVHEYHYMDLETEWINVVLFRVQQIGINNLETAEYCMMCSSWL